MNSIEAVSSNTLSYGSAGFSRRNDAPVQQAKTPPTQAIEPDHVVPPAQDGAGSAGIQAEQLKQLEERFRQAVGNGSIRMHFSKDMRTESLVVQVVDSSTEKVVRQFPAEELLQHMAFTEDLRGLFVKTEG